MKNIASKSLLSSVITSALMASSALANEQIVTLETSLQSLYPQESFEVSVNYSVTHQASVSGLGIQIFFDSTALALAPPNNVFGEGKIAQAIQQDTNNLDGDLSTDTYVNISWMSFSGQWPMQMSESLELARLSFTSEEDFTGALIYVGKSSNAAGYEFIGQSLYISAN